MFDIIIIIIIIIIVIIQSWKFLLENGFVSGYNVQSNLLAQNRRSVLLPVVKIRSFVSDCFSSSSVC